VRCLGDGRRSLLGVGEEIDGTKKEESKKEPSEKWALYVYTVGINGVAYHFDKLA
jgi:hypothetical protein